MEKKQSFIFHKLKMDLRLRMDFESNLLFMFSNKKENKFEL